MTLELDDGRLVQRMREGDEHAFAALVRKYQRRVFRLAFGLVKDEQDAMDIAQDAFVKVHQNLQGFKGDAAFYTWLYRITTNLCIDHLRKKRGEAVEYDDGMRREDEAGAELGLRTASKAFSPVKSALDRELAEQIAAALQALSPAHREILLLRELEGLSYEELADTLGIKKGTVMSRLFHARKNMQAQLAGYARGGEAGAAGDDSDPDGPGAGGASGEGRGPNGAEKAAGAAERAGKAAATESADEAAEGPGAPSPAGSSDPEALREETG